MLALLSQKKVWKVLSPGSKGPIFPTGTINIPFTAKAVTNGNHRPCSKWKPLSKVSLKLTRRINLERKEAHKELSTLETTHKPPHPPPKHPPTHTHTTHTHTTRKRENREPPTWHNNTPQTHNNPQLLSAGKVTRNYCTPATPATVTP